MRRSFAEPVARRALAVVLAAASLAASGGCLTHRIAFDPAADPRDPRAVADAAAGRFVYYTGVAHVLGDLETLSRVYRRRDGAEVELIAMVHFADRAFYEAVARRIAEAHVVLLEGSADGPVDGARSGSGAAAVGASPEGAAADDAAVMREILTALDLVPQPEGATVGPPGPRYERGDIDPDELARRVAELREHSVRASGPPDADRGDDGFPTTRFALDRLWYGATFRTDRFRKAWRHHFARRLRPIESVAVRLILIDGRDAALLASLDAAVAARPRPAPGAPAERRPFRIAVPWGGEHMPGIERGLLARGFIPVSTERLIAWRIRTYEEP